MIIWGRPVDTDLRNLLESIRVAAKAAGKSDYFMKINDTPNDLVVTCPRYDHHGGKPEKTPSCFISKEDGLVHCFGCGYATTVAGMTADILGLKTPVDGFQWIRRKFSSPKPGRRKSILGNSEGRDLSKIYIPEEALLQYNFDHPYMFKRCISPDALDWFSVGYDKDTKSLTLPMRDAEGRISFIKERPVGRSGFGKYQIEAGADKRELLYGLFMIKRCLPRVDMIFISEGEFDVLSWYSVNRYAVGLQGSDLFDEQVRQLIRVARGKPICIATDNDKAGFKAKYQCIDKLSKYFPLSELVYPGDKYFNDPNDLLKAGRLDKVKTRPIEI